MRFAWPVSLLPVALSLACSNAEPAAEATLTTLNGETSNQSGDDSGNGSTSSQPTTGDSLTTGGGTFPATSTTEPQTSGDSTDPIATESASATDTDTTSASATDATSGTDATDGSSSTTEPLVPGCADGQKNGDETDQDCGGGECPACAPEQVCVLDTDCDSALCVDGLCAAPTCDDGATNQDETDIDCGGDTCEPCPDGESCQDGNDCLSGKCTDKICQPPACDDAVQNQDETDLDCGGMTCEPCPDGDDCLLAADCASGVCTNNACEPATCGDAVQNQDETGVDCGGADCAPCQLPGLILNEVDYDNVGTDSAEFVEIYNNTGADVPLTGISLVLVNGGNNSPYLTLPLGDAVLAQGQYLVVANAAFVVPPGALKVTFAKANDNLQNDSEGVALLDTVNNELLDALSYEGAITAAMLPGLGVTSLVEGAAFAGSDSNTMQRSLARFPNGNDKNDAATDWILSKLPTPALANGL